MRQDAVESKIHCGKAFDSYWRFYDLVAEFTKERAALVHVVIVCCLFCYAMALLTMVAEVFLAIEVFGILEYRIASLDSEYVRFRDVSRHSDWKTSPHIYHLPYSHISGSASRG